MKKIREVTLEHIYRKIVLGFIIINVILILLILYFSFNRAIITIFPKKEPVDVDFLVRVEGTPSNKEVNIIPGQVFETTVEGTKKFNASGSKILETGVSGKVMIINNSSRSQTLVATTRLLTPEKIIFRTKKAVTVPARGKIEVEVYADNPDLAMEIGPTKFTIPGLWVGLQEKIYGESYEPFRGVKKEMIVVSQTDLDEAKKMLSDDLVDNALEEFKNKLSEKIPWKIAIAIQELSSNIDARLDEPKEEFTVNLRLKIGGVAFDNEELLFLAQNKLENSIPSDNELIEVDKDSFKYTVKDYDLKNQTANLNIHLAGVTIIKESSPILDKNKLVGLTKDQVEAYLKNFKEIEGFKVKFSPPWVFKAPKLKDHIIIRIQK